MTTEPIVAPGTPVALAAFKFSANDPALPDRLKLSSPEQVPERDPNEWGIRRIWLFKDVKVDTDAGRYLFQFEPNVGPAMTCEWCVIPWSPTGAPDFGSTLPATIHSLKVKAAGAWQDIAARFEQALVDGAIVVAGRQDSPLAPLAPVPGDAWAHFQMHDWDRGYAEGARGERLYGLQVASRNPSADEEVDEPIDKRGWKRRCAEEIIGELYPNGNARALPDKELVIQVGKRFVALHPGEKPPGLRTIRRAAGKDRM